MNRFSPIEWSGSGINRAYGSKNTVCASSNEIPCLAAFDAAFWGSHSNERLLIEGGICHIAGVFQAAKDLQRQTAARPVRQQPE
jgi:hypothetical protein